MSNKKYELVTPFNYDKTDNFLKLLFEVQKRSFAIKAQIKSTFNYLILTPTTIDDYDELRQIATDYTTFCKVNNKQQFLTRNYSSRSSFNDKFQILNKILQSHDISSPLCYQERINQSGDPCFETSLIFTMFVPKINGNKAIGDIWLSHVELCNIYMYQGAVERSTMVNFRHQSKGIGQTAVKALYSLVIGEWFNKKITLINNLNELEQSNINFTGVYSFVDYRNFKSLGNNIKSMNDVIGISNVDRTMIIFRAMNKNALNYNLVSNIKENDDILNIVIKLINVGEKNEYDKTILQYQSLFLTNAT